MVIKVKGHDIKLGFGLYFLGKAQKKNDTDLQGLLKSLVKNPIADMCDLMWFSAVCEAELDEVELPIKKRDLIEFLEETKDFDNTEGILAKWSAKFTDTIRGNFLPKEESKDDGVKKKLIGVKM